jgi:hypothetical protein
MLPLGVGYVDWISNVVRGVGVVDGSEICLQRLFCGFEEQILEVAVQFCP